ncbi:MAG: HAD family hydrolase [Candidatus Hadarchaeales archaeon]
MGKLKVKAVISDLDCTLVYTLRRFFEVFNDGLVKRGMKPLPLELFFKHYTDDTLDDVVAHPSEEGREEKLHEFWMEFLWKYREEDPRAIVIPGVVEALEKINKAEIPVAIMTSCIVPVRRLKKELDSLGIGKYVREIATAHDVLEKLESGHHFSKVDIIRLAAERLQVFPKSCVVVGDYWNDIRDGKKLGCKTVAVLTGLMRKELLMKYHPDVIVEGFADVPEVLGLRG